MAIEQKEKPMVKAGKHRGDKVSYPDGVGCCIWKVIGDSEDVGICFDYNAEEADEVLDLIKQLKDIEPKVYVPDPNYEEFEKKTEKKQKTWWYRLWDIFDDIGVNISPFDWRFRSFFVVRPTPLKDDYAFKMCKGFFFGPITITW